ncbi:glycosyltransferase family 9 protein [Bradyrhizobium niftali]|uniref:glycosyltransferase family 9 protein n=1 Tax=Bradyrhizobium niftali TaxID=2560055 RepID=UPI00384A7D03
MARGPALVTAASGIGDIIRITPLIRALHGLGHAVDVLLAPDCAEAADLLRGAPEIRRLLHTTDVTNGRGPRAVPELGDTHYEVATFTAWSAPLARQVKADRSLAFAHADWLSRGDIACAGDIACQLGWEGSLPEPFAMSSQRDFALPAGMVALHPGCKPNWPWKKWHGFDALAHRLDHVAVIGTAADLDNAQTYFGRSFVWPEHARLYAGKLSLLDTAALIRQSAALVANDSGLMHLGVALKVPTFGIFGITSPAREAIPSRHMVPVSKGLPCEAACREGPWGRRDCQHHLECLRMLTADEVLERVNKVLPDQLVRRAVRPHPDATSIRLNYHGEVSHRSGYGEAARAYVRALHEAGIRVSVTDTGGHPDRVPDDLVRSLIGNDAGADFNLFHGIPPYWARTASRMSNVIAMTVWETDTMPPAWRNPLLQAIDVWLPCRFNTEVFARGLGREPFCIPHPVPAAPPAAANAVDWAAIGIRDTDFLFYACFEWQERKNPNGLFEAFLRAFPSQTDTVLLVKTGANAASGAAKALADAQRRWPSAARVLLRAEAWDEPQLAAMHARGDCYVSLHKGEGWGYPLFEAACHGNPVVATAYSGPLDYLDPERHWLVRAKPAPVRQSYQFYSSSMRWGEPDVDHAVEGLRWVHANRDAARKSAQTAAGSLQSRFCPARVGELAKARLVELLARTDSPRAGAIRAQTAAEAPPVPIPAAWYDADYFETGRKSNWKSGYRWPLFRGVFTEAAAFLAETFPEAESFLDAGCAKGFLVRALRERGLQAWGFDHSPWAIEQAETAAYDYLSLASVETATFDRSFDVLLAMSLLESLTEDQLRAFLDRARTWTRQALFAVIPTLNPDREAHAERDADLSHITMRDRTWWQQQFNAAGWRQDSIHRGFERSCQAHPFVRRMNWSVYVFARSE